MWNKIKLLRKYLTGKELDMKNVHADFEKPALCAVLNTFPNCNIVCRFFHLNQSFYRKIQKHYYLHSKYKEENSEVGNWLRYFYGLAFLPPSEVGDGYAQLMSIASNIEHVTNFTDYYYASENADFKPSIWAAKPSNSPRTTNGPESFHSHYNS
jgi:hypothetical protein